MLSLILQQTGIHFDYDTLDGSPDRNKIRLLHRTAARLADGMCNSYKDARRAGEAMLRIDPAEVAERASHALHKLMPRRMVLEGLDDDGLASVLAAAAKSSLASGNPSQGLEVLWLQRGFRLPYLETLNLCECVDLTDGALASVTACSRLSSLLLAGCDSLAGSHRFGGGRSLTALDVSDIAATTDAQLTAACADSPDLRRLDLSRSGPGVRSPSLGGTHLQAIIATRCEHLGDDAVTLACGSSPALQTLMLALCTSLHSPRIHGERLSELNLSGCSALQDAAVTFACQNAPTLRRLSLSLCAALVAPRVVGPYLQRVELSHCEALSLPLIGGLAMVELSLSGCSRLEDAALDGLCDRAPALRKLSISGCTKLKDTRLRAPALMVLNCHGVARSVVDTAADRLQCPQLHKLVSDTYVDAVDAGFEEVD